MDQNGTQKHNPLEFYDLGFSPRSRSELLRGVGADAIRESVPCHEASHRNTINIIKMSSEIALRIPLFGRCAFG
jgi:hypothetical protein